MSPGKRTAKMDRLFFTKALKTYFMNYNRIIALIFGLLSVPCLLSAQDSFPNNFNYGTHIVYPPLSISRSTLNNADSIGHLNRFYKTSWIKEFLQVEIQSTHHGIVQSAFAKNDKLTAQQKKLMQTADYGTEIIIKVDYIPENNLKHNDPKEIKFKFLVDPESSAEFYGGNEALQAYLKENAINRIPIETFKDYLLAIVQFTINEDGEVENPYVFQSSNVDWVDDILLKATKSMPCWKPATYANGTTSKQKFAFYLGNTDSCTMNLINIRR